VKPIDLALVGATGLVGRTTLDVLAEWNVPLRSIRLFASDDSAGRSVEWNDRTLSVEPLNGVPKGVNAAIFATSRRLSEQWVPAFRDEGIVAIDHSSRFRMDANVPLVIPEINARTLRNHRNLIANPNCTASVVVIPLAALQSVAGLRTVIVDSYQSVSGSGQDALAELEAEISDADFAPRVYPRRIAHNVFPQVGAFDGDGHCDEESKVVEELRKILAQDDLAVFTTTVRVPVRIGHSAAVTVECEKPVKRGEIEVAFRRMPGMIYEANVYRTPLDVAGRQEIFVSRLRIGGAESGWLQFWAVGDNLRKGAASNAVQILIELFKD